MFCCVKKQPHSQSFALCSVGVSIPLFSLPFPFNVQVLEGVLPLLTGSQSSESRRRLLPTQDDSYSFQVIRQVIARILPLLAGGSGVDEAVKEKERHKLLVSLLSQVRDVPAHRRLPLLDSVVRTLQPSSCLHVAVAVLLQVRRVTSLLFLRSPFAFLRCSSPLQPYLITHSPHVT